MLSSLQDRLDTVFGPLGVDEGDLHRDGRSSAVAGVTRAWGAMPTPQGKIVWARLATTAHTRTDATIR